MLAASLLVVSSGKAQESDYLIVSGQRLAKWELGKPLDAYELGQSRGRWEGRTADGKGYYEGYGFMLGRAGPELFVHVCKSDSLVFAIFVIRRVHLAPDAELDALRYKTPEGIGIGSSEDDARRLLGRPAGTRDWAAKHGTLDVAVLSLGYPGLSIDINKADRKVFAIGVATRGAWNACQEAVLGRPTTAQQSPSTSQPSLRLPVPMPSDLRIVPPASDVPPTQAAYSGIWVGKWDDTLDTALAVAEIRDGRIRGVYAWGTAPAWNISRPGWEWVQGTFAGSNLRVELPPRGSILYRIYSEAVLEAILSSGQFTNRATLRKVR